MLLKISEFARLGLLSVKTLRYYDEIGLLRPAKVDEWTKYRYYSAEQLPTVRRIVQLKGMGFSLMDIGRILNDNLETEQIIDTVRLKRAELIEQLTEQQSNLNRLDYWLEQLQQERKMSNYQIEIKTIAPVTVTCVRKTVPSQDQLSTYLDDMFMAAKRHADKHNARGDYAIAEYYDEEWTGNDIDVAAAIVLNKSIEPADGVDVREMRGGLIASVTHVGPFRFLPNAYQAVLQWIPANGYRVCGPGREFYHGTGDPSPDQSDCVTEVQFFVEKV